MTNPNNALGTNAALGGRTSVDAFNDAISSLTRGVVSGFAVTPSSAMTLNVGGTDGVRDVAVAVSPNGNRVSVDNRTTSPIKVTMAAASASSARIDAIVAYVNSPSQVTETTPDNPTACGIIPVSGTASAQPTDSAIRTAISADGGTGSTAYYAIIAIVRLAANTTTITSNMITAQKSRIADSLVTNASIADKSVTSAKVDWATFKPYWKTVATSTSTNVTLPAGYRLYRVRLCGNKTSASTWGVISCSQATGTTWIYIQGMSAGNWVAAERSLTASSDKAVMDGARNGTATGYQTWDITISRPVKNGAHYMATWETGMTGSLTFNTGRSTFDVTNGSADMNLFCELSPAIWSVEAFVEN